MGRDTSVSQCRRFGNEMVAQMSRVVLKGFQRHRRIKEVLLEPAQGIA